MDNPEKLARRRALSLSQTSKRNGCSKWQNANDFRYVGDFHRVFGFLHSKTEFHNKAEMLLNVVYLNTTKCNS